MLIIERSKTIQSPLDRLWKIVSNPFRQRDFVAYKIISATKTNAADVGPDILWHEKGVLLGRRYDCECKVFGWEPPQWYCFGTRELFHVSFELEPNEKDIKLLYRVELPQTPDERHGPLTEVCDRTVSKLKALAEGYEG